QGGGGQGRGGGAVTIWKAFLVLLLAAFPAAAAPLAYVSNERAGTVTVIDTATRKGLYTLRVGYRPRGIQISPDGARVYVALSDTARNARGTATPSSLSIPSALASLPATTAARIPSSSPSLRTASVSTALTRTRARPRSRMCPPGK